MRKIYLAVAFLFWLCAVSAFAQAGAEAGILSGQPAPQPVRPALPQPPTAAPQTAAPVPLSGTPTTPAVPPSAATEGGAATSAPATSQAAPVPTEQPAGVPATSETVPGPAPLHVTVNKTILINTEDELKRVSVTDPTVADAVVVSLHQVMVNGRAPGEVTLILWDMAERSRSFDLLVDVDAAAVAREIGQIFPDQQIRVTAARSAIILAGHVATDKDSERAGKVAEAFSKNVVNALTSGPVGADEILLEVKFAEVDRTRLDQFGVNLFSTGAANTPAATSTGQFGGFSGVGTGSIPLGTQITGTPPGNSILTGAIGNGLAHQPTIFGTNNLLNLFLFRSDLNLGAIIQDLQQENILQILAEPNLIAVNGKEANFLAGGEFPFPVPLGYGGAITVTIQFKEFGVRLKFVPVIMPNGNIHLKVAPEVSALDFTNALTLSGFVVPALTTRRAETEIELKDGQSFVIAGMLDNRLTDIFSKMPGVGDIPILGELFKSKSLQKSKTELMVLVTARRVSPDVQPPPPPPFLYPFLNDTAAKPKHK